MKLGNKIKASAKILVKLKYEIFESSGPPKSWILPKLYELCKCFRRNPV